MNTVILCEGFDDVLFLGYYIHKISNYPKWIYQPRAKISDNFSLPLRNERSEKQEIYTRGRDKLLIWCVGGKDCFDFAIKSIYKINTTFPLERFEEIILFSDRDNEDVITTVLRIQDLFKNNGWNILLENNMRNLLQYVVENESYDINISPIIIPFDKNGALETILMDAIAETSQEDEYVVKSAQEYIDNIINSKRLTKYLQQHRLILKAKFSAVISITNPDRSTSTFDKLLITHDWETKDRVKTHLNLIARIFR